MDHPEYPQCEVYIRNGFIEEWMMPPFELIDEYTTDWAKDYVMPAERPGGWKSIYISMTLEWGESQSNKT